MKKFCPPDTGPKAGTRVDCSNAECVEACWWILRKLPMWRAGSNKKVLAQGERGNLGAG